MQFGLAIYNLVLILAIALLYWKSVHNLGLLDDDGSSELVFASRFLPTLVAVIYVFVTMILLDDVKRIDPFVQLSFPSGAPARVTLLQNPGQWWTCLWRSFPSRKRDRTMNWVMLCSSLLYVVGILVLSPFSSALMETQQVPVAEKAAFERIDVLSHTPLSMEATSEDYFRTIAHTLQNVSTSAWITDMYYVVPFWPSSLRKAPLGPKLSAQTELWQAPTTVFTSELTCEPLELSGKAWHSGRGGFLNSSMVLSSQSGCSYGVLFSYSEDTAQLFDMALYGGGTWSKSSSLLVGANIASNGPDSESTAPSLLELPAVNSSGCKEEIIFFMSNPITETTPSELYVKHPEFKVTSQICSHAYYMADVLVTADTSQQPAVLSFNKDDFTAYRRLVEPQVMNIERFQDAFLSMNWTIHLLPVTGADTPVYGGPSNILAARDDFSLDTLMENPQMMERASRLKQRFFGEVLHDTIASSSSSTATTTGVTGTISRNRRRVVVVPVAALTLGIALVIQILLLGGIYLASRPQHWPLNLSSDPATPVVLASLIAKDHDCRASFDGLANASGKQKRTHFGRQRYRILNSSLHRASEKDIRKTAGMKHHLNIWSSSWFIAFSPVNSARITKWQPLVFELWALSCLVIFLSILLVILSVLYHYSRKDALYQTFFVYEAVVQIGGKHLGNFGPTPVVTTFVVSLSIIIDGQISAQNAPGFSIEKFFLSQYHAIKTTTPH